MLTWEVLVLSVLPATGPSSPYSIVTTDSSRTLQYGLQNGGTAGLIYGFIFAWIGAILQALVMAEMASMSVLKAHLCFFRNLSRIL